MTLRPRLPVGIRRPRRPAGAPRLSRLAGWPRLPRRTVRLRLTLLYGGVFLAAGAGLLTITYVLTKHSTGSGFFFARGPSIFFTNKGVGQVAGDVGAAQAVVHAVHISDAQARLIGGERVITLKTATAGGPGPLPLPASGLAHAVPVPTPQQVQAQAGRLQAVAVNQHNNELHQLIVQSGIALAIMTVISMGLGWLLAGRALAPLRTITGAARRISATSLHERLALEGPDDELTELGDTFDGLLARLESSFQAQRQFVANASHELRTPLTLKRALLEVALADPDADAVSLRRACERALAAGEQQERIVEALLTLAVSERGVERREPLRLDEIARDALAGSHPEIERQGLRVESELALATISGDASLLERLVVNLIDNATRHNVPGGLVRVTVDTQDSSVRLAVSNTGPVVPATDVKRLLEPFQRLDEGRIAERNGLGLGLSIVRAIAHAHEADLRVWPRPEGGLDVEVYFPAAV